MTKFDNATVTDMVSQTETPAADYVVYDSEKEIELIHDALVIARRLEKAVIIKTDYLRTLTDSEVNESMLHNLILEINLLKGILNG
jgi:hypothetical protein